MSPPSWVLKLGDRLRTETTALGGKLRTETTALVELLKTPPPNTSTNEPVPAVNSAPTPSASAGGSGLLEFIAVTSFIALLVFVVSLLLMEDQQVQRILDRSIARLRGLVKEAKGRTNTSTEDAKPSEVSTTPAPIAATNDALSKSGLSKTMMAESYVEVDNDVGDFEIVGHAKWHERSFVTSTQ